MLLLHFGQLDAEGGALVDLRFLHIDFAAVIFFDDAFHQRQSQSPSAFLGGVAGIEHVLEVFAGDAFARVFHVDDCH